MDSVTNGRYRMGGRRTALVLAAAAAMVGVMATSGAAAPGDTTMISDDGSGLPSTGDSTSAAVSSNGRYVAFQSDADNLVPQDNNELTDIFVRDRQTGAIERVSVNSSEIQARNGLEGSMLPSISADGRYVAFASDALNLVTPDPNQEEFDVFVRDRVAGTTERVNVSSSEAAALNGESGAPSISPDGRYVTFESFADNLVAGDTNGKSDVFVRDRTAGTTQRVSIRSAGGQGLNGDSLLPSISPDGRYVAFESAADNLVTGDLNGKPDIFVRDRTAGTTQMVSVNGSGAEGNEASVSASISSDGRRVAFESSASNLAPPDANGKSDVFVRDLQAGTTKMVSVRSSGVKGNGESHSPSISGNGGYVAFESIADNLVAGDLNGKIDIFVHELAGATPPGDTTPPTVTEVSPLHLATAVPAATNVTATFSEAMRRGSINTTTFTLAANGSTSTIAATVVYDATTKTATLDPTADLAPGTYVARVKIGARDLAGNQLDQNPTATGNQAKTWRFTVG